MEHKVSVESEGEECFNTSTGNTQIYNYILWLKTYWHGPEFWAKIKSLTRSAVEQLSAVIKLSQNARIEQKPNLDPWERFKALKKHIIQK